ncbi:MAG: alpha/beta fold hydrolase [Thioalkalivibrio sp.]
MEQSIHADLKYCHAADGQRLGYRAHPSGRTGAPALVMLHGLASNGTRFSEFCANTCLRGSWDLYQPDLRGHGASMTRARFSREVWCRDQLSLLDAQQHPEAVFMGHSLGAQVAMELAVAHPDRVRGLILIDPVFPEALGGAMAWARRLAGLWRPVIPLLRLPGRLFIQGKGFPYRDLHALDEQTRALLGQSDDHQLVRLYMNPHEDLHFLPLSNYLQDLSELMRPVPDMSRLAMPVLVLRSTGARLTDQDITLSRLKCLPNVRCVDIAADHWLLTERPKEARIAIEQWCMGLMEDPST